MENGFSTKKLVSPVSIKATDGYYYCISPDDVMYIASNNNNIDIFLTTTPKPINVYMSLKDIWEYVCRCSLFLRINRKIIINKRFILKYNHNDIVLNVGKGREIEFSYAAKDALNEFFEIN